jgi:hypothetical protein
LNLATCATRVTHVCRKLTAHPNRSSAHLVKETLDAWLAAAGIESGPLFRCVCRADKLWGCGISEKTVLHVVKKTATSMKIPHIAPHVRSRSIQANASFHLGARLLIAIDIRGCFPSISNQQVYRTWTSTLGCSARVGALLTKLTTFERRLPQGAPTSPALANLFIWSIDGPIRAECARLGVKYSTWIDDLAFSGDRAREIIEFAARALAHERLAVSRSKIKIMGPRATKLLTGTRLGSERIRAPRDLTSRVRAALDKVKRGESLPISEQEYLKSLGSQIKHIGRLCPGDIRVFTHAQLQDRSSGRISS